MVQTFLVTNNVNQRPCLSRYDACPEPGVLDAAARVFQRNWGCGGLAARC